MGEKLGVNIKKLRQKLHVTQAVLAKAVGVSVQAVSKWECGGTPDIELLPRIADYFSVTIDQLFDRGTDANVRIDRLVVNALKSIPDEKKMEHATEILWGLFKGMANVPNTYESDLITLSSQHDIECTRCRCASNDGVAYVCANDANVSFFIMPEPKDGYSSVLLNAQQYAEVFSFLGEYETMKVFLYIAKRKAAPFSIPFSMERICSELNISHKKMQGYLQRCIEFGWLQNEQVELINGESTLYCSCLTESTLAFLYYCAEMMKHFKLWYLSNITQREKPMIS